MSKAKKSLKDLVAANYIQLSDNNSPYANLRYKLSPKKLQDFINGLSDGEKEDYFAYCNSPSGKREQRELDAKERRASRERALIRKKRIFNERFSKLALKVDRSDELKARRTEAKALSIDEIAQSLIIFPELLPEGQKAPALTLARKHLKAILSDEEKEYLVYVWAVTLIPAEICYSSSKEQQVTNVDLS
jgi:hypothetical protein